MAKHGHWLVILTVTLIVLACAWGLGATSGTAATTSAPPQVAAAPAAPAPDDPAGPPSDADTDPRSVTWQRPELAVPQQGVTPDFSFADEATVAGKLDVGLDRTSPANSPGVYMARDWRGLSRSDFPMLVGGHDLFQWRELEPSEGVYDWHRLDDLIAGNAASGKKTGFGITAFNGRIQGGLTTPDWLGSSYPETIITCTADGWRIPRYWNSVYKTKYTALVQAMADRYKYNPNVAWVQIGIGLYGEIQPADDRDDGCVKTAMDAAGRSDYQNFWTQTLDSYIDIFGARFNSGKPVFLVFTPSFVSKDEKCYATQYGAGKYPNYFGLFAGGVYANQLDIFKAWPAITYPAGCSKWDPIVSWNNSPTATIPTAFETYGYMLPDFDTYYWGMLNALNKHPDYLNLESDLFFSNKNDPWGSKITQNFPMMYFANQYLGKTLATTPNVWVAMREYDPATNGYGTHNNFRWPQWGNYDFWLTQDNTVAGGRTVSATTVSQIIDQTTRPPTYLGQNPWYDPILAGKGPQGWITRRTSHASGNDYFYLNVNDTYAATRLQAPVLITVTWFDVITTTGTTWALEYKDAGGATQTRTVTRGNSRTWVRTSFYLTDAAFNGQFANGNDFRLYNGGTADLYVHFVAVGPAVGGPPVTETPTRTPTVTATGTSVPPFTPTRTRTPTLGPSAYDVRVNAGGPNYTDSGSNLWLADRAYTAGSWGYTLAGITFTSNKPIAGTNDAPLFQTERYWEGNGAYRFDVPAPGPYEVRLLFSENSQSIWKAGLRLFTIRMEGQVVFDNFDIWARAPGTYRALVVSTTIAVNDGALNIDFVRIPGKSNPKVNAIRVIAKDPAAATPTRTPTRQATPIGGWPHGLYLPLIIAGSS